MKDKAQRDNVLAIIGIIFFVFLVIYIRTGPNTSQDTLQETPLPSSSSPASYEDEETSVNRGASIVLEEDNYHFTYTVFNNEQTEIIDGERNGNKQKFSIIGSEKEEYAKISENYLKLESGSYQILNTDVRSYFPYIDLERLERILQASTFEENDGVSTYTIDVLDLLDFYTELDYSGFDTLEDDQVIIYKNKKGQVYKVELDYSHYFAYQMGSVAIFRVTMEFDHFGDVRDLDI